MNSMLVRRGVSDRRDAGVAQHVLPIALKSQLVLSARSGGVAERLNAAVSKIRPRVFGVCLRAPFFGFLEPFSAWLSGIRAFTGREALRRVAA